MRKVRRIAANAATLSPRSWLLSQDFPTDAETSSA